MTTWRGNVTRWTGDVVITRKGVTQMFLRSLGPRATGRADELHVLVDLGVVPEATVEFESVLIAFGSVRDVVLSAETNDPLLQRIGKLPVNHQQQNLSTHATHTR